MALKIRGESEFSVSTTRDASEVLVLARGLLKDLERTDDAVLTADVSREGDSDFQIEIVLRVSSYAQAEEIMTRLLSDLAAAIDDTSSSTVAGATELVPA